MHVFEVWMSFSRSFVFFEKSFIWLHQKFRITFLSSYLFLNWLAMLIDIRTEKIIKDTAVIKTNIFTTAIINSKIIIVSFPPFYMFQRMFLSENYEKRWFKFCTFKAGPKKFLFQLQESYLSDDEWFDATNDGPLNNYPQIKDSFKVSHWTFYFHKYQTW